MTDLVDHALPTPSRVSVRGSLQRHGEVVRAIDAVLHGGCLCWRLCHPHERKAGVVQQRRVHLDRHAPCVV